MAVSSGEGLSAALLRRMQAALPPDCRILNIYGGVRSTEVLAPGGLVPSLFMLSRCLASTNCG